MKFPGTKKMTGSTNAQAGENRDKKMRHYDYRNYENESPQKYLKFWGKHYPYLNGNNGNEQRWLPIPENSEAQRFIRSISTTLGIRGCDEDSSPCDFWKNFLIKSRKS